MTKSIHRWTLALAGVFALAGAAAAAPLSNLPGQPGAQVTVRSGGASIEEEAELRQQTLGHSLKLVLAAKGSGAYLADVNVVVRALPSREVVLEHRTEGPLMLAALPAGRYEIVATYDQVLPSAAKTVTSFVTIAPNALAQRVIYFDTGDKLSEDLSTAALR